jgi:thiamine phosphate synthase YjbQ (UPF0047 family)
LPRKAKSKYKKDEPKESKVEHCKVFDVIVSIAMCIKDGWMTLDEWEQIYLGVKERVKYVGAKK